MSRLIPRKKGLAVMLEELVSLIFYGNGETKFREFWTFFLTPGASKTAQPFGNRSDFDNCRRNSACFLQKPA